jgi:hypothetical protein
MDTECDPRDQSNCYESFNKEWAEKAFETLVEDIKKHF